MASGRPVLIDLPGLRVRTLRPSDASAELSRWFADPARTGPMNVMPVRLEGTALRRWLGEFDNRARFLAGVFDGPDRRLSSVMLSEHNLRHRVARLSWLAGETDRAARRAMLLAGAAWVTRVIFERERMAKCACSVTARNRAVAGMLRRYGFRHEGTLRAEVADLAGTGRLDQQRWGLLPGDMSADTDAPLGRLTLARGAARLR